MLEGLELAVSENYPDQLPLIRVVCQMLDDALELQDVQADGGAAGVYMWRDRFQTMLNESKEKLCSRQITVG